MVEERRAVGALERRPAVLDRVEQPARGGVVDLPAGAQRARHRHQRLADRREREAPVLLDDHILEREPAQDPRERARVGADGRGELRARLRAVRERLGDPELGRDVQQLRHDEAIHKPKELPARIDAPMIANVLWTFIPIAVLVTITPGAATAMVIRSALRGGWRDGVKTIAGNSIGVIVVGAAVDRGDLRPGGGIGDRVPGAEADRRRGARSGSASSPSAARARRSRSSSAPGTRSATAWSPRSPTRSSPSSSSRSSRSSSAKAGTCCRRRWRWRR